MGKKTMVNHDLLSKREIENLKKAEKFLGDAGKMIFLSKSPRKPTILLGAYMFSDQGRQIWSGDLDIEADRKKLIDLSHELEAILYILLEYPVLGGMPKTIDRLEEESFIIVAGEHITFTGRFGAYTESWKEKQSRAT